MKVGLFQRLAKLLPPPAILGSNTSSISLTKVAGAANLPGDGGASAARVVGIHFFNPVNMMKLCEVIPAIQTSPEVVQRAKLFGEACGKGESARGQCVQVRKGVGAGGGRRPAGRPTGRPISAGAPGPEGGDK